MAQDGDSGSAARLRRLRWALANNAGVREALLDIAENDDFLWSTVFTVTVSGRFAPGSDIRDVTAFTARITADDPTFPARQAEAIMRAAMGEISLLGSLDPTRIDYPQTWITIAARIFEEWRPNKDEISALIDHIHVTLRQGQEVRPTAEPVIERWLIEDPTSVWRALRSRRRPDRR